MQTQPLADSICKVFLLTSQTRNFKNFKKYSNLSKINLVKTLKDKNTYDNVTFFKLKSRMVENNAANVNSRIESMGESCSPNNDINVKQCSNCFQYSNFKLDFLKEFFEVENLKGGPEGSNKILLGIGYYNEIAESYSNFDNFCICGGTYELITIYKDQPTVQDIKSQLESPRDEVKIATMKKLLLLMLNGDPLPQVLMHVIRFIMPSKNKQLKKLLLIYWEICPKLNSDGKLKQEMILMCNALRNDLQHPNEFIRGMTLRFVCKLKEAELLEPTIPTVKACLEHRHPFVRKNAILAISTIYKNFEFLIPDAPELIKKFLHTETDPNAKRNAFLMLMNTNQQSTVEYLDSVWSLITTSFDENLQLAAIELIRKDCKSPGADKAKYIQCIFSLLNSTSHSVKYEAANTLVALSPHSTAVKAAASCYIELVLKESDNNVKLIVLKRLNELREKHDRILDDLIMDILRVLTSPDIEVRRMCLSIAMDMVSNRNVDECVSFLKKELVKTHDQSEYEKNSEYKQLLIHSIHQCAIKFSEVAANVVHVLMEFVGDSGSSSAVDVISFVREVMEKFPHLRSGIIDRLCENFNEMKTSRVFRGALWIIGEYAVEGNSIVESMKQIRNALGEIPILASEQRALEAHDAPEVSAESPSAKTSTTPKRVLADGTYATETSFSANRRGSTKAVSVKPPLRALLLNGDFFLGSVLSTALTKLVSRFEKLSQASSPELKAKANELKAEAMLIMTSIIRIGKSDFPISKIDEDSHERILTCLRVLSIKKSENSNFMNEIFLEDCRNAYKNLVLTDQLKKDEKLKKDKKIIKVHADDLIGFRHLKSKRVLGGTDEYDLDLNMATGNTEKGDKMKNKLSRVIQLTGYSDPVYAEAYVNVHQYDILLDVLIVNQTNETMQNLTLEFSTLGDLKLVERPTPYTLAPHGFHSIKANIKVSSTETGVIFGNIVYDGSSALDMNCVILNDIHIDIMDYINPAYCTESQFRNMWMEFEWENKVNVNTNLTNLREYLDHILKCTNMACLTPENSLQGDCGILAGNLYAKSIFGEDALANICLEWNEGGNISGHIRIRSKTQGIALSLGDKITVSQKGVKV
ncbi:coatomer subunit beta [Lobulomyces angularis]|nr:coatomer subunit beta [Lobulomyces angularis]